MQGTTVLRPTNRLTGQPLLFGENQSQIGQELESLTIRISGLPAWQMEGMG
jgi:hypothetical protein